jgi:hypothetical protein
MVGVMTIKKVFLVAGTYIPVLKFNEFMFNSEGQQRAKANKKVQASIDTALFVALEKQTTLPNRITIYAPGC